MTGVGFNSVEHQFTDTNPIALSTILNVADVWDVMIQNLVIRAGKNNQGTVYFGNSDVTVSTNRGGYLDKEEAVSFDMISRYFSTRQVYLVAQTANDVVHITVLF